jgi:flagellar motor switch protein FliG
VNALGDAAGNKISAAIPMRPHAENRPLAAIESSDPGFLAEVLVHENPQTITVILAHVSAECASGVLKHFEHELRSEVVLRMACLESVSPNLVSRIARILERKLSELGAEKTTAAGGPQIVADLLNRVSPDVAERILASMDAKDQETAGRIRDLLFVFEDLKNVDIDGIRELVKRIDRKVFTVALKGVSEELTNYICESMSKRGAEMLREDMEALGPVKIKEVEAAQKEILQIARTMEAEGVLSLSGADANEYVQ